MSEKFVLVEDAGIKAALAHEGVENAAIWRRPVWDGTIMAVVVLRETGWNMSLTHRQVGNHSASRGGKVKKRRYPNWAEVAEAREELLGDFPVVCTLPSTEEIAKMDDCSIDVWEFPPRDPNKPPPEKRTASGLVLPA